MTQIIVRDLTVSLLELENNENYISLTDIAKARDNRSDVLIQNWLRNRSTIEFIGLWEILNNDNFNSIEFDGFKNNAGSNSFVLTPKEWIERTNAIGIISKRGRYGGTYAHKDIAFEFATWISPEFKLYLIKEFQRLKEKEINENGLEWNIKRNLAKINYRIHTQAIQEFLLNDKQNSFVYSTEADMLNKALFGKTAKEWRVENPEESNNGNIRDYATHEELLVLANIESLNAKLIEDGIERKERFNTLRKLAIKQLKILTSVNMNSLSDSKPKKLK